MFHSINLETAMPPRPYDRTQRDRALAETRRSIVEATVALHAERGASRTSYADIAARADVAIPTVYKHFPTLTELFSACTGHAMAEAPPVGPHTFAELPNIPERVEALVRALFARYRYLSPWLRWSQHEAHLIPELGAFHAKIQAQHLQLIRACFSPRFGARVPRAVVGLTEILTRYSSFEVLTEGHGLSDDEAACTICNALRGFVESPTAAPRRQPRPRAAVSRRSKS
jgi:AcrR family transcriptional regulator